MMNPTNSTQDSSRIEDIGLRLVPTDLVSQWRAVNINGSTEERLQVLLRWAAVDSRPELSAVVRKNAKPLSVELLNDLEDAVKGQLRDGALPAAVAFVHREEALWKTAKEMLPSKVTALKQERERLKQALRNKLKAIRESSRLVRRRRLNRGLADLVEWRNQMSKKEADEVRCMAISNVVDRLLNGMGRQSARLTALNKKLTDVALRFRSEMKALEQDLTELDIFEEKIGSRADVAEYFGEVRVDVQPKLPGWLDFSADGIEQIATETLSELDAVDQVLVTHRFIDKKPQEMITRIGRADRLSAPYVNLAYDPDNAPIQTCLLTGYEGDVDLAVAIPQGIPVAASRSLNPNEVILAQVRLGIELEALAGLDDWRAAAEAMEQKLPLYTMDPTTLEPL